MLGSNGLLECCGLSGDHRVVLGSTSQRCIIIVMEPDVALAEELAGWDASHNVMSEVQCTTPPSTTTTTMMMMMQ